MKSANEKYRRRKLRRVADAIEAALEGNVTGFDTVDQQIARTRAVARMYLDIFCVNSSTADEERRATLFSRFELIHPRSTASSTETLPIPPYGNVLVISELSNGLADAIALLFPNISLPGWASESRGRLIRSAASQLAMQLRSMRFADAAIHPYTMAQYLASDGAEHAEFFLRLRNATLGVQVAHEFHHGVLNLQYGALSSFNRPQNHHLREAIREILCDRNGFISTLSAEDALGVMLKSSRCSFYLTDSCKQPGCSCRTRGKGYYTEFVDSMCAAQLAVSDVARLLRITSPQAMRAPERMTLAARRLVVVDLVCGLMAKAPQRRTSTVRCVLLALNLGWRAEVLSLASRLYENSRGNIESEMPLQIDRRAIAWRRRPLPFRVIGLIARFLGLILLTERHRFIEYRYRRRVQATEAATDVGKSPVTTVDTLLALGLDALSDNDDESATSYFEAAVDLGSVEARDELGVLAYRAGDFEAARQWWVEGPSGPTPSGLVGLGRLAYAEDAVDLAVQHWELAASRGDPSGLLLAGSHYAAIGQELRAIECWRHGVQLGDDNCALAAGGWYAQRGDLSAASEVLTAAANSGHHGALTVLAEIRFAQSELEEARATWTKAAAAGSPIAPLYLVLFFDEDPSAATKLATLLPAESEGSVLHSVASTMYRAGLSLQAERYWKIAADTGHAPSVVSLAAAALDRADPAAVEHWISAALAVGEPDSIFNLGAIAEQRNNRLVAIKLYQELANAEHADAMHALSQMRLEEGEVDEGLKLLRCAADLGHVDAMNDLGAELARAGDEDAARAEFERAAEKGSMDAIFNLGVFSRRRGDDLDARRWWVTAAAAGHEESLAALADLDDLTG